jgi:hypothetical protein
MRADIKRIKLLFKVKTQLANNSSCQERDERHNTEVDKQMHIGDAKIVDLVKKHQKKKKKCRKKETPNCISGLKKYSALKRCQYSLISLSFS